MPAAPRPSCVRCVITSSRLYTTPSVTLRRHKAAAHLLRRSLALSTTNRQTASTIGTNRPHFALHGGQREPAWSVAQSAAAIANTLRPRSASDAKMLE
ncbi:hypothetical protein [Candidatus Reidiella endopervernicosa]|uniref:Uncharacterized protein n=1 Tax=Candidatus Reidiella endopervernicosa TaxID=2738883 RepID=A0A6N0HWV5_9GAMM|nr:hypothetical protein [Candidatus Reidiella endopervernicosa]QKQ26844.1 hypothetical protein HUE57_11535 [Candidatus Reidiella endopervernicosa]